MHVWNSLSELDQSTNPNKNREKVRLRSTDLPERPARTATSLRRILKESVRAAFGRRFLRINWRVRWLVAWSYFMALARECRTGQDRMRWPRRRAFAATPSVGLRACNAALRSELAVGRRISRWYWSRSGSGCSWTLLLLLPLYDARQSTEARPLPVRYVPRCVQRVP